jgi:hypothetical protein
VRKGDGPVSLKLLEKFALQEAFASRDALIEPEGGLSVQRPESKLCRLTRYQDINATKQCPAYAEQSWGESRVYL